uniref:Uncharacterized protein n=1 Tax=Anguilla anguilla TaxID=7936 RepID=A0A0E9PAZ9_ANGAN
MFQILEGSRFYSAQLSS